MPPQCCATIIRYGAQDSSDPVSDVTGAADYAFGSIRWGGRAPGVRSLNPKNTKKYGDSALNSSFSDDHPQSFSGSDGFGPRLPGLRMRPVNRCRRARKRSSPSGRPMLSAAQAFEQIGLRLASEQIGELREAIPDGFQCGDTVVFATQMRTRARPPPILRPLHQPRPHRVQRHVAQRSREMLLVHGDGAEPALPEMAAAFAPCLDDAGIASMHARECAAQPVGIGRHQDQMHVVRHQAPSSNFPHWAA